MQGLLVVHIFGALVTAGLIFVSIYSILKSISQVYKKLFISLVGVGIFQIGSGIGLFITSENKSILGFCAGLGFYLSAVIFTQSILFLRLRQLRTQQI
ncbi:MAG: hypothetical protein US96_C0010G0007 [Candidatus Woesebacteria bacterium GW2011_GWB1_38_5b]|uniref:Uncharacterized protein n=1 Tax=Candidatus Woesebacteria bacterium GW2011_GWB1_38_5b TaxID=1618569 RepID=A0A0G0NEF6_9BACT|nr:MAG: hypothetical protein US96_C0010G0007 [Candidatus Woesebacteria bacterium GW2011_GWB1_38_5b]